MSGKRLLQKENTKKNIIKTAMGLYASKGFSTPTNMIAKEAGVSHGAIFVHFPTRDDLLLSVLEQFTHEVGDELHNLSITDGSIYDLLCAHIQVLEGYESFYQGLIKEMPFLPDEVKNMVIALQSILSQHFNVAIERGKREGSMKDIPIHLMFNTWIGLVHYYLQNSDLFAPGESVLKRYKNELVNSFMVLISK
jgi:AcrR family transcriptional regulator